MNVKTLSNSNSPISRYRVVSSILFLLFILIALVASGPAVAQSGGENITISINDSKNGIAEANVSVDIKNTSRSDNENSERPPKLPEEVSTTQYNAVKRGSNLTLNDLIAANEERAESPIDEIETPSGEQISLRLEILLKMNEYRSEEVI